MCSEDDNTVHSGGKTAFIHAKGPVSQLRQVVICDVLMREGRRRALRLDAAT